jgi:hypothetical protein
MTERYVQTAASTGRANTHRRRRVTGLPHVETSAAVLAGVSHRSPIVISSV